MNFNEKLQKLRKENGLSQEQLAEKLGVSRQAISKWESGASLPEIENLIAVSALFNVTVDELIKDSESRETKTELEPEQNHMVYENYPFSRYFQYEYKSEKKIFGMPLVHVNVGWGLKKAKGFLAIGNMASGIFSIGLLSKGIVSLGAASFGLISFGTFSLGLLLSIGAISVGAVAIGAIALGLFALGAVSIGMFSIGALSIASHVAVGDHAYGEIAVGRVAKGAITFFDHSIAKDFSTVNAEAVRKAIYERFPNLWQGIVDIMVSFLG